MKHHDAITSNTWIYDNEKYGRQTMNVVPGHSVGLCHWIIPPECLVLPWKLAHDSPIMSKLKLLHENVHEGAKHVQETDHKNLQKNLAKIVKNYFLSNFLFLILQYHDLETI
jgi:hypothetical protein